MPSRSTFLPELESLRGIAILLVFLYHADGLVVTGHAPGVWPNPATAYVRAGHVGVDLFFVLSGFLLAAPFLTEIEGGRRVSVARYFERRVLRIMPAYTLAVLAAAALTARAPHDLLRAAPYLLFLQSLPGLTHPLLPYSIPWWSLATEVQFYLVLPLATLARSPRLRWLLLAMLAGWAAALGSYLLHWWRASSILHDMLLRSSFFGRGPVFLCGVAAAWLHRHWGPVVARRLRASPWALAGGADAMLAVLLLGLGALLGWVAHTGPTVADYGLRGAWHTIAGVLWAGVMLLLLVAPLRSKPLFANELLGTVGRWSYSLFLIHLGVLHWAYDALVFPPRPDTQLGWTPGNVLTIAAVFAVSLAASALSYRVVERPFLEWKSHVAR